MDGRTDSRSKSFLSQLKSKRLPVHQVHATPVMNARSLIEIGSDADVSSVHIETFLKLE